MYVHLPVPFHGRGRQVLGADLGRRYWSTDLEQEELCPEVSADKGHVGARWQVGALRERSQSSTECPGLASTPQPWSAEILVAGPRPWLITRVALGEAYARAQQETAAGDVSWAAAIAVMMSKLFS